MSNDKDLNPLDRGPPPEESAGPKFMRGCGIAAGIAGLVFLLVVGACFMSF